MAVVLNEPPLGLCVARTSIWTLGISLDSLIRCTSTSRCEMQLMIHCTRLTSPLSSISVATSLSVLGAIWEVVP